MPDHRCVDCGSFNVAEVPETPEPNRHKGGRTPYGFYVVEDEYRYEPFITGPVLVWLMRCAANGWTYRALATQANTLSVAGPAGGPWTHSSVWRVIKRGRQLSHLIPIEEVLTD